MKPAYKNLGKVRPTVDNNSWSIDNAYDLLTIVYDSSSNKSYISIKDVPTNIVIDNREYWLPFGVGKFVDNAIININYLDGVSQELVTYTLEEAIARIDNEDKRLGVIISFYGNEASDFHTPGWCLYQFMSDDLNDWNNVNAWNSIYYNRNKNVGWFRTESELLAIYPSPHKGDYCYIGTSLTSSFVYRCYENGTWINTQELASANIGITIGGNMRISENGTWIIDNEDTGIKAVGTGVERMTYTPSQEDGGTNILQIKLTDGTQVSFPIKNGSRGNSGIIVPNLETFLAELVNDVVTDDATKGLSAAQGVVLNNKISQLGQEVSQLQQKSIKLVGIGTIAGGTSGITAAGQYYYNTSANTLYLCTEFNTSPSDSTFEEVGIVDGAIFTFNNHLYVFNGTTLVVVANIVSTDRSKYVYSLENFYGDLLGTITIDGTVTKIRDFILNQDYGLKQGFWLGDDSIETDPTRVSTKLIDALNYPLKVYISPSDYIIKGYMRFASDYTYIDYTSSGFNNKNLELPAGYIYEIVFAKSDGSLSITPAEVVPYVMINDRKDIYTLKSEVNSIKDSNSIDSIFPLDIYAQENLWYLGTSVGDTISSTTADGTISIKIPVAQNEQYELKAKGGSGGRGWYLLDSSNKIVDLSGQNFNDTIQITIPSGVFYLIAQSNGGSTYLSLKKLGAVSILGNEVEELQNKVQENTVDSFKGSTAFLWNKLARLKTLNEGFCNIGFIGDSWTQGTENIIGGVNQGDFQGYVKPLSKMLQDEYGYGGLGWLDFARDGGSGQMFGCANMWENISYAFTGTITGLDGNNDQQAPDCLGICCAHIIFSNNATLSFTFGTGMLDKFKIRYYKDAHFNVSINGGAAVEITANSTDGWQETEIGTTGTDITSVLITSLADNTIIFGMDCFYGTHGVRCHKIGNRSIEASDYLKMNATQWGTGIALLGLSWASVLLAINDLGGSTDEGRMNTIVSNIGSLIDRLKVATDDGNGLVTCDINLLGVENIENSGWTGLGRLAEKQKTFAANSGYGWTNTDKCIGSNKAEFTYNGTFSDQIHLNKIGSYAYAKHIYDSLFRF